MLDWLINLDQEFFHLVNRNWANPFFDVILPPLRKSSNWYVLYALIAFYTYYKFGWRHLAALAITAGVTIFISDYMLANSIKHLVQRMRPCNNDMMNARLLVKHCGSGYSFVSAHACNHFALAVLFATNFQSLSKKLYFVALIWAGAISFAQVYVGVHYPFDVICGGILGIASGLFTSKYIFSNIYTRINR